MDSSSNTVLVLGANGRLGQAAVAAFAAAGWRVLAQLRRAPQSPLPAGAQALRLPLHELAARAGGTRVVVHALNPVYTRWASDALPLLRQGMDLAQQLGATFMLPGNLYNHGSSLPPRVDVGTPQRPDTRKGRIRVAMESEMQQRSAAGLRCVVLRAGDFFGNGCGAWLDRVVLASLARRRLAYPGPLDVPHAWAYLPDLARALVAVAAQPELPAFTELLFAGHTLSGAQLLAAVERAAATLGIVPAAGWRHGHMPWALLRAGAWAVPMWREVVELEYLWRTPHRLDGSALQALVGELPATPIDSALRQTLLQLGHGSAVAPAAVLPPIPPTEGARR